jgi:hypothetical protein
MNEKFDPEKRAEQKQASRDDDARRLASGEVTREQLRRENSVFSGIDFCKLEFEYK